MQRPIWLLLTAAAIYWAVAPLPDNVDIVFEVLNAFISSAALAMCVALTPTWVPALFKKPVPVEDQFMLALGVLSGCIAAIRGYMLMWRVTDTTASKAHDMLSDLTLGFFIYLAGLCYLVFLLTPGAVSEKPRLRWIVTGCAFGLAALIVSFIFIGYGA